MDEARALQRAGWAGAASVVLLVVGVALCAPVGVDAPGVSDAAILESLDDGVKQTAAGIGLPVLGAGVALLLWFAVGRDLAAGVARQAGGFAGDDGGGPFGGLTPPQRLGDGGQVGGQRLGESDLPRRTRGRHPPRQPDLFGDPPAAPRGRHTGRGLGGDLTGRERDGLAGLSRRDRTPQPLQTSNPVDPLAITGRCRQAREPPHQPIELGHHACLACVTERACIACRTWRGP